MPVTEPLHEVQLSPSPAGSVVDPSGFSVSVGPSVSVGLFVSVGLSVSVGFIRICRLIGIGRFCKLADRLLSNEDLAAFGAMFALGLAFAVIGRLDRRVDHLGVSLRGKYLLTDNYRAADRTMFAFGESCLSAGRLNSGVNYFRMTLSRNITGFVVFAVLAVSLFFALFGAGRSLCRIYDLRMSLCCNIAGFI